MKTPPFAKFFLPVIGALLPLLLGFCCWRFPFADALARFSYDFPFAWRNKLAVPGIVLVYIDEDSARALHQRLDQSWDRRLHAQLLDRLTKDGAKAVMYDIIFSDDGPDPSADVEFADAMRRNGSVYLGAALEGAMQLNTGSVRIVMPTVQFRKASAGRGLLQFLPVDPDFGVRQIFTGTDQVPALTWLLAQRSGAVSENERQSGAVRWINYPGPSDTLRSVGFAQALAPDGLPPGFFHDQIVVIGGRPAVSYVTLGKDEFATPYTRWGSRFNTGMEIHGAILANLLNRNWLTRLSDRWELAIVLAVGLIAGVGFPRLRPDIATASGLAAMMLLGASACIGEWSGHVWFNWAVPALVEIPVGVGWSVGWQYVTERRRRSALRRAFSLYLSPQMAERIANSDFDLTPGGRVMEASVMFTDLQGFTALSEDLGDPRKVSDVLIAYFNNTTGCILESDGTIVKYMGDAVLAVWGAPLEDASHPFKAAQAALNINQASRIKVADRSLVTRVGVNSGPVLSGNLGSTFRFDYACIGDTTNFASRLESLNKYLGTEILIGENTHRVIAGKFVTRALGRFIVAGKKDPVGIHELIAPLDSASLPEWCELFQAGLNAIQIQDYEKARAILLQTIAAHGGADGPADFYLKKIEELRRLGELAGWDGCIRLTEK